jgi:hypothetical protein
LLPQVFQQTARFSAKIGWAIEVLSGLLAPSNQTHGGREGLGELIAATRIVAGTGRGSCASTLGVTMRVGSSPTQRPPAKGVRLMNDVEINCRAPAVRQFAVMQNAALIFIS